MRTFTIKAMMAGASAVMVASSLLKNGISHLSKLRAEMESWMNEHEYSSVSSLTGRMSRINNPAPAALERTNYIEELNSYG